MARMDMTRLDAAVARFGDAGGRTPSQKEERAFENGEAAAKRGVAMASPPYTRGSPEYAAWLAGYRSAEKKRGDADVKAPTEADAYDHGEADGHEGRKAAPPYKSEQLKSAYMEGYARGKRARGDSEQTGKVVLHDGKWWYRKSNDTVRHGPYASGSEASSAARAAGVRVDDAKLDAAIARMDASRGDAKVDPKDVVKIVDEKGKELARFPSKRHAEIALKSLRNREGLKIVPAGQA